MSKWQDRSTERADRIRLITHEIHRQIVKPPGSDCWVYTGRVMRRPTEAVAYWNDRTGKQHRVGVVPFLRRAAGIDEYKPGIHHIYRTSCGLGGRCVSPAHNSIHRTYPYASVREWRTEERDRWRQQAAQPQVATEDAR